MVALCRIELLGQFRVHIDGQSIDRFRTRKTAGLLAYLAYHLRGLHSRDLLADLFWPECDREDGRHNLSMALSALRPLLLPRTDAAHDAILIAGRHSVGLNAQTVATDVAEFDALLQKASGADEAKRLEALTGAVGLYRGEFLRGFYEEWVFPEQQRLHELFFRALHTLIALLERAGDYDRALGYALEAVRHDPSREEHQRDVIRLYLAAGQPRAAIRQYREIEQRLQEEFGIAPDPRTRALLETLGAPSPPSISPQHPTSPEIAPFPSPPAMAVPALGPADRLEPVGGAVPLDSRFYITRATDEAFQAAIARRDGIVLVKGPRQVGKTSLLGRGLHLARQTGVTVVLTHFQTLNEADLASADTLLPAVAEAIAEQLDLDTHPSDAWDARGGANLGFRRFLRREVLNRVPGPLVWALDEVDRLFNRPYTSDIFGLFRSWHDERVLSPEGPWGRLTLTMAYSTEAYLFITDVNQSPFNVGTRLSLEDFTLEQAADLNRRYGSPLKTETEFGLFYDLLGGQPYLVRRALYEMAAHGVALADLAARATAADGIFGEHLRRIAISLQRDAGLLRAVQAVMAGNPCPDVDSFYRLRSAGVLLGDSTEAPRFRCGLYAQFLRTHASVSPL